jgi:SAM-dependent methyltransferase
MKGIKEYYDDTAQDWADAWYQNNSMLPFLKECASYLNENAKVLDLGCNCGYETKRMKELGLNPTGLDFSQKSIDEAKKRNKDIEFVCDNMLNDLTYLGTFDAVIAIASIIHIKEEDLELCFKRIYDILNTNGYLFMVLRVEEGKLDASYKTVNNKEYDREVFGYSKSLLEDKMNNRFKSIKKETYQDEHWVYYWYQKQEV